MRVLFVTQSLGKGGAERLVLDIAHELKNVYSNVVVKIVPLGALNDYLELSAGLDIEICTSKIQLSITGKSQIDISDFERIVDEFQPDIIHSHTYIAELISRENVRQGIAYFSHVHGDFPEFNSLSLKTFTSKKNITHYFERRRIFKKYSTANNQFITISTSIDQKLRQQLKKRWATRIQLIPNGINFSKFEATVNLPDPSKTVELITIGRLFPVKNQQYLIGVVKHLLKKYPSINWQLNILGQGPEQQNLLNLIKQQQLSNHVHLKGLIANVEEFLKQSHFYLHSAISEPFGLVIVEAMAAALPVISLDAGGNRDIVHQDINGFILPQSTKPDEFADKIIELTENSARYSMFATAAVQKAKEFDIAFCVEKIHSLYKDEMTAKNC
ncbi:MAG: glycosyltransferase family 4 protein [Bacteroidota bacterium]